VRIEPDEETQSLLIFLGAEFHPPAIPEPEPIVVAAELEEEIEEPQPVVPGQPTAGSPRVKKGTRKAAAMDADGNVIAPPKRPRKAAAPRKRRTPSPAA
jgi:hypothetical protein